MFGQLWTHDTIRKYVIFFGSLFNEVYLGRGPDGTAQVMRVPLNYGPKEKFLARLDGNDDLDREIAVLLPRMSFEITGFQYDADRKLQTTGRICAPDLDNPGKLQYQYNPVPWNIMFELSILVKNAADGTRIIEQILPFFTPEFTGTLNLNTDMGKTYDVPLVLNTLDMTDTYEGTFQERRAMIWTLQFTLKGWLFGGVRKGSIIKQAEVNFKVPSDGVTLENGVGNTDTQLAITVTPGLTANGEPTSDPLITIDKALITSSDNYGFITEFDETLGS